MKGKLVVVVDLVIISISTMCCALLAEKMLNGWLMIDEGEANKIIVNCV